MNIFNLVEDEKINVDFENFQQIAPHRTVSYSSFKNGVINYNLSLNENQWLHRSKCYIKTRLGITQSNGTQLVVADNVAPNYQAADLLFESVVVKINGVQVDACNEFYPENSILKNRLQKSIVWVDQVGLDTNFMDISFNDRQTMVTSDGTPSTQKGYWELTTPVNVSFFTDATKALPGAFNLQVSFNPNQNYENEVIQTGALGLTNYKVEVFDQFFYACVVDKETPKTGTYSFDVMGQKLHKIKLNGSGYIGMMVTVDDHIKNTTIAFQDSRVSSDPFYSRAFFKVANSLELSLKNLDVNYKNKLYPNPRYQPLYDASGLAVDTDYLNHIYMNNILNTNQYFTEGSCQSLMEFEESGIYAHLKLFNPTKSKNNNMKVNVEFSQPTTNTNMLVFEHSLNTVTYTISGGRIEKVELNAF